MTNTDTSTDVNTKYLQARGRIETFTDLKMGDDVVVTLTVTSIKDKDNNDGTTDRVFKAKLFCE